MSNMTNKEKRELARILYCKGAVDNQGELASRLGISEQTISKWKKQDGWEDLRKSLLTTRQEELRNLYDQLSELNASIKSKDEGKRYADSKEADIQRKITASIRELETETSLAEVVDVFTKFNDFVQKIDFEKAKEMIELQDGFIKSLYI